MAKRAYAARPRLCMRCTKKIPYEKNANRFCGHACSAVYWNSRRVQLRSKPARFCRVCSKPVGHGSAYACSRECHQGDLWSRRRRQIEARGEIPTPSAAKRYLAEAFGYACANCGISEWDGGKLTLSLDHADGDPYNNKIKNLRLLCPNCHSQTPSYAGRNRGRGRVSRAVRDAYEYELRRMMRGKREAQLPGS